MTRLHAMLQMLRIWKISGFMSGARRHCRTVESGILLARVWARPLVRMWEVDWRAWMYIGMKTSWMLTGDMLMFGLLICECVVFEELVELKFGMGCYSTITNRK